MKTLTLILCFVVLMTNGADAECSQICPMIYAPVCASDGNTYSNECDMNAHACRTGTALRVIQSGQCNN